MAVDPMSRRALLEAKQAGGFAPRHKVWPPEGYVAPTAEEFAALRLRARSYVAGGSFYRAQWERVPDAEVTRHLQLLEILPRTDGRAQHEAYDYAHALRREASRRGLVHRSIAVLRCECCSHATQRLFEATQDTHPGMTDRRGNRVASAFFCARCWSGDDVAGDETEDE